MNGINIPVSLVEAWVFIQTYDQFNLSQEKHRAQTAIKEHFGTIEVAQNYIDECRNTQKEAAVV